jgi:uncharacterized protein (DUF2235 family)
VDDLAPFAEQPRPPDQATESDSGKPKHKNIVVCCDGTGNEFNAKVPDDRDKGGNSNVVKFYTALDLGLAQYAYYHPGVGTMGDPTKKGKIARKWSMVKGLAFGLGFQDNVLDAYRYLMQHYNRGDTVYILGFSRGAYTARALAGFLHGYGLLCRGNEGHILYAWNLYTAKLKKQRMQPDPKQTLVTDSAFRDTFSHQDFMIQFMGLWDTVSSVGWITTPLRLLHLAQNPSIYVGRHAVSIDERRCFYHDNLWGDPVNVQLAPILRDPLDPLAPGPMQDIAQVWFPGVHSDVGGSYGQYSSGLANESLTWMMAQAAAAGAVFKPQRTQAVLGEPVTMDPQERTEELQLIYPKPKSSEVHKSLKGLWRVLEIFPHRYYNTDADKKEILRIPWGAWRRLPDGALLHPEVLARRSDPSSRYDPANLKCGTISPVTEPGWEGYGRFSAPPHGGGWRQNFLLVFAVKTVLTAIPVMILRPLLLWLWRLGEGGAPGWLREAVGTVLTPAWVASLGSSLGRFAAALGWSLVVAMVVVVFWTLFRVVRPRA